ncbi:ciliary microtubule inner protein 1-like [Symsagittifera roscoffensis]|uniref:ciliary microtubule inner protein 1-like n=1 Tax=Symsagittifera roscoffensis TaxID=84072 RepID=UPI00307BE86B
MVQQVADDSKLFNEVDYVGRDKIWSDYVKNEENSAKIWNGQWSFLKGNPLDLIKDKYPPKTPVQKLDLPTTLRVRSVTPISRYIKVEHSGPAPRTTTGEVGWRSADPKCQLEIYGHGRRPKQGILKQLNWPIEACL